jgi:hypothetical protein
MGTPTTAIHMEKEMGTENKLSTFSYIHPTMTKRMMQIQIGTQPIPLPSLAKCRTFVVSKKRLKSAGWRKSSRKEMAIASLGQLVYRYMEILIRIWM